VGALVVAYNQQEPILSLIMGELTRTLGIAMILLHRRKAFDSNTDLLGFIGPVRTAKNKLQMERPTSHKPDKW